MGMQSGRERNEPVLAAVAVELVVVLALCLGERARKDTARATTVDREMLFLAQVMTSWGAFRAPCAEQVPG
jgi:hypothetical protein